MRRMRGHEYSIDAATTAPAKVVTYEKDAGGRSPRVEALLVPIGDNTLKNVFLTVTKKGTGEVILERTALATLAQNYPVPFETGEGEHAFVFENRNLAAVEVRLTSVINYEG